MKLQLETEIAAQEKLRNAFNSLTQEVFGFSFEDWYQSGYWTERYQPYTLFDGNRAAANVSVNQMEFLWDGQVKKYIQLGTVMTAPEYRGRGLSQMLIERVLSDWQGKTDGIYLFANQTVLDFYPKFGFERQTEYQFSIILETGKNQAQKLNLDSEQDRQLLKHCYQKGNPYSRLAVIHNFELLMFYCEGFLKDHVYYLSKEDAVVIAQKESGKMICYDVFGDSADELIPLLTMVADGGKTEVILGFTPNDAGKYFLKPVSEDNYLFTLNWQTDLFYKHQILFPLLSHT